MDKNTVISVNNLGKTYKLYAKKSDRLREAVSISHKQYHQDFHALQDINFEVYRGETLGIIGTNGSGKSTLLKILTGVVTPSSGEYSIHGRISALLELGAGFNPEYTGLENIDLSNTMLGCSGEEAQRRKEEIIQFADIGDYINQPVKNYSSGMFARLAFAVAISSEPEVLVVDEALSVGDVFFQNKCYRKFDELKHKGVTILFVSHDIGTVRQLCSRVLWIERGVQQMIGDSKEVCNAYSNSIRVKSSGRNVIKETHPDEASDDYHIEHFTMYEFPEIRYSAESQLNPKVRILSAFFTDHTHSIVTDLTGGNEYTFSLVFQSDIDLDQCITGFVIENTLGQWIINCNSAICGKKATFSVQGNSVIKTDFRFTLPQLLEGEYIIGAAVSNGTMEAFEVLTWLYQIMNIRITNVGANSAVIDVDANVTVSSAT